jgi:hypothetical protein
MATRYALQQQGVMDGTQQPANKADSRETQGNRVSLIASKDGAAWNNGDIVYLGKKPAGYKVVGVRVNSDTSFGTATVSIGTGTDPRAAQAVSAATAYVNAKTMTAVDTPTYVGPKASVVDDAPSSSEEHLWATIGVANIGAAVVASIEIEMVGIS